MGDIVQARRGQVYIFNKEDGDDVRKSRRILGECDGLVWKNHGTRDYNNVHIMYAVAWRDEAKTEFKRTIYWHLKEPYAIVHYKGEFTGSTPKVYTKGRRRVAVEKYQMIKDTEENPPVRWKYTEGEPSNNDTIFQPTGTLSLEDQMRQRAESRPVQGETKYHRAVPFDNTRNEMKPLQPSTIELILRETPAEKFLDCSTHVIHEPKEGDLFLFQIPTTMTVKWNDHILKDGYKWSYRVLKEKNVDTFNTFRYFITTQADDSLKQPSKEFKRMVYYDNHYKRVAIHYIGDSEVLQKAVTDESHAQKVIPPITKSMMKKQFAAKPVLIPLTLKSSIPLMERENVTFIAEYMGPEVVRQCDIQERKLNVVMMDHKVVAELRRILNATQGANAQLAFHYTSDLQFKNYQVSILSIRHELLQHISTSRNVVKGLPTLPLVFHIHNQKGTQIQSTYLQEITQHLDKATNNEFSRREKILVTDETLPKDTIQNTKNVRCWNSILRNVKSQMELMNLSHLYDATAVDTYKIANANSEVIFEQILDAAMKSNQFAWASEEFRTYFQNNVATVLRESSGKWKLEEEKLPFTQNGITNNSADGLKEVFQNCTRTRAGHMNPHIDISTMLVACKLYSDNELVKTMMAYYSKSPVFKLRPTMVKYTLPETRMPDLRLSDPEELIRTTRVVIDRSRQRKILEDNNIQVLPGPEPIVENIEYKAKELFTKATFEFIMDENRCQIIDENYSTYSVKFGERQSCSCETVGFCEHVIAVDAKLGKTADFKKPSIKSLPKNVAKPNHPRYAIPVFRPTTKKDKAADAKSRLETQEEVLQFQNLIEEEALHIARELTPFTRPDLTSNRYEEHLLAKEAEDAVPMHEQFKDMAAFLKELHQETLNKRLDINSLDNNVLTLEVGDIKHIETSPKTSILMKCTAPGEVVVFGTMVPHSAAIFAAKAVQHHITPNGLILVAHVNSMATLQDANDFQKDTNAGDIQKWEEFKTVCHCRVPTSTEEIPNLAKCNNCQESFHQECLPMMKDEQFVCACCSLTTKGATWGAGMVKDTCTIDNALTSILIECKDNLKFTRKVRGFKYDSTDTNSMIRKTLDYAAKDDWAHAQETWNKLRLKRQKQRGQFDTISMAGTPEEQFFDIVQEGGTFRTIVSCTSCGFRERSEQKHVHYLRSDAPLEIAIQDHLSATMLNTQCKECNNGKLEQQPICNLTKTSAWYMHFSTSTNPFLVREVLENAPKNVFLQDGSEYRLGLITLAKPGHFASVLVKDNQFLYYDDIKEEKITRLPDNIFAKTFDSIMVHSITYFWQQDMKD